MGDAKNTQDWHNGLESSFSYLHCSYWYLWRGNRQRLDSTTALGKSVRLSWVVAVEQSRCFDLWHAVCGRHLVRAVALDCNGLAAQGRGGSTFRRSGLGGGLRNGLVNQERVSFSSRCAERVMYISAAATAQYHQCALNALCHMFPYPCDC